MTASQGTRFKITEILAYAIFSSHKWNIQMDDSIENLLFW